MCVCVGSTPPVYSSGCCFKSNNFLALFVVFSFFLIFNSFGSKVNYQYRNGTSFPTALRTLYADGGIPRFYRGLLPALIQGPLSRFGDTAANTGVLSLMNSLDSTKDLNVGIKTMGASAGAALFRIFLMPVDTVKTTMQVTGKFSAVVDKVKAVGPLALYNGSIAAASATFVGHYP